MAAVAAAPAAAPGPPVNDNYLQSFEFNTAGTKLNRTNTLEDIKDTTLATVQHNIFDPCLVAGCPATPPPGPPEHTSCSGISYGNTVWYDFYPDANGMVRIRTSGDNLIALYTFNTTSLVPSSVPQRCLINPGFPSVELIAQVKKGIAYTFQVGETSGATGKLQLLFDYFVTPKKIPIDAVLTAGAASGGLKINTVRVTTSRSATVSVSCSGRCHPKPKSRASVEKFNLGGVFMPTGSKLLIRATAKNAIGAALQYTITPTGANKATFCTEPGSNKLRKTCH